MFRHRLSQVFGIFGLCASLAAASLIGRTALAAPTDIVDLEGDTHHDPPAATTGQSGPAPTT